MVDAIESKLGDNVWLGGQQPSKDDKEAFAGLNGVAPNVDTHPNAFAWFSLVSKFTDSIRDSWTAAAPQAAGVSNFSELSSVWARQLTRAPTLDRSKKLT